VASLAGSRQYRRRNCGAKRAGLAGARDLHGASCDVRIDLHDQGVFFSDTTATDNAIHRNPVFAYAFDNDSGAECSRLDQSAVDIRTRGVQRLAKYQAAEPRIYQYRSVAVVPVKSDQSALTRLLSRGLARKFSVQSSVTFADHLNPPVE